MHAFAGYRVSNFSDRQIHTQISVCVKLWTVTSLPVDYDFSVLGKLGSRGADVEDQSSKTSASKFRKKNRKNSGIFSASF